MSKKAKKKWVKKRHKHILDFAHFFLAPYTRRKYGVEVERFDDCKKRQYLVLFNHQTAFDQFFVGMSFRTAIYFIASEDMFSIGLLSKLLTFACAPIPIKKQTRDLSAVRNCVEVAKQGGTIVIAPEGQRTYSGETTYISPAIVSLAKVLNLPIAFFKIEGGYGIQPRWSNAVRKGKMKAHVTRVMEPDEYKNLSKEDFLNIICSELYENEATNEHEYTGEHLAEYMERMIYVCPECGLSRFESHGNFIHCTKCGMEIEYKNNQELKATKEEKNFPYRFALDWYKGQEDFVNNLDLTEMITNPVYTDTSEFYHVVVYKKKELIWDDAKVLLYGNRIEIINNDKVELFDFDSIKAVTVVGNNKVNLYRDGEVYQLKGDVRFNALKYVNFYHRYKNISEGNEDVKFLGL